MTSFPAFFKSTLIGGFFVVLPLVLLYLLVDESLKVIVLLATPIADLFPAGTFDKVQHPVLWGALLLTAVSFVAGIGMRHAAAGRITRWLETRVLGRLPAYSLIKSVTAGLAGVAEGERIRPGLLQLDNGGRLLVLIVEDRGGDDVTVLMATAPAPSVGAVLIVPRGRITAVDATLGDALRVFSQLGVGAIDLASRAAGNARTRLSETP